MKGGLSFRCHIQHDGGVVRPDTKQRSLVYTFHVTLCAHVEAVEVRVAFFTHFPSCVLYIGRIKYDIH